MVASKTDPHAEILKLQRSIENMRYRHKTKLRKVEHALKDKQRAQLYLICQMVGEGMPRDRIRNEIIEMVKE